MLGGYGPKKKKKEYQKEGFEMFEEMIHRVEEDVVQKLFTVELARESVVQEMEVQQPRPQRIVLSHWENVEASRTAPAKREGDKVGRNFFFQAEDGIRDTSVTGVQTCALPI